MLQNRLVGLEAKGKELREQEAIFLKMHGLREQIEETRSSNAELDTDIQALKEELAELKGQKAKAVAGSVDAIREKMDAVLPEGKTVFEIDDAGGISIGWKIGKTVKPYRGLSGGEKVVFDGALANALGAGMLIYEAAEADGGRLEDLLLLLADSERQIVINTWAAPGDVPDGWTVTEVAP